MEDLVQIPPLSSILDVMLDFYGESEKSSLGFMELLNMQDLGASSVFDVLQEPLIQNHTEIAFQESSEVVNTPATPNYSSISTDSSGGPNDQEQNKQVRNGEEDDEQKEEEHKRTNKLLKPMKTSQKKSQRVPRFAFMTKSEVDHLEDGYRWRKYGQKAVKNSTFPRSYYRCTNASCNVKKRVERSFNDPSIVVTTYEGQHTHPSPVMARPTPPNSGFFPGGATTFLSPPTHCNYSKPANCGLLTDNGLLQDIVLARKKE